ncbi:MAG: response regulator [Fibrobacter sp.]|nr:response regulator [Fibrobacter sp.]
MKNIKIMVIDDDPVIRELLRFNLAARGYEVISVSSGGEALEILADEQPDIVLLDVIMPEMDGWEVLKIMRDHFEHFGMKILMLTAKSTEKDKLIGKSILKADEYITKPFDIDDLLKTIEAMLGEN